MAFIAYIRRVIAPQATRTVRYVFSLVVLVGIFAGMAAVVTKSSSGIILTPSQTTSAVGDIYTVLVEANVFSPVNAITLSLTYDPDIVEVFSIDKGQTVITLWTKEPSAEGGRISLEGGTYRKGFIGKHEIITVSFRQLKPERVVIQVEEVVMLSGDGTGAPVATAQAKTTTSVLGTPKDGGLPPYAALSDFDNDGSVSLRDVSIFMVNFVSGDTRYDINGDGKVNFTDFSILLAQFAKR